MTTLEVLQVPSELKQMVKRYRLRKPKRVLEIGTWEGGTLRVWLEEGTPELVVAVDLEHRYPDAYDEWRKPETELRVITGNSWDQAIIETIRSFAPYDWAFIDGDHGERGVRTDVATVRPLVRTGGLMLLHDIEPQEGLASYPPGNVLRELAAEGLTIETWIDLTPQPWAHGIGVVHL